jgi:outer membrane protein assembly factor BamE (lipoprotein component of BamABCDE complex)
MKKSLSLVMATLLFVVLGCSLGGLTGKKDEAPKPATDKPTTTTSTPTSTTSDAGGKANLSIANFNKLKIGMSYDEVKGIMGSDGNETASSKSGSRTSKSIKWEGDKFARVNVRFTNDKLVYRSQSGLTPRKDGSADISQAKFNKVNTGMTYAQVKEALGSDGELMSETEMFNTKRTTYTWRGKGYSNIRASFKDDKLTNKFQSGLKKVF